MNRNIIYLVALIGLHLVLLQWYKNEVHKLDTDNSGCVSNAEIAGQSSGDTIPGLTPEATKTIKAVCVKNGDQKLDEGELDNCERDASAADKPATATTKSVCHLGVPGRRGQSLEERHLRGCVSPCRHEQGRQA